MADYGYAGVLTKLGRHDEAMAHLTSLVDSQQGSVVFLAVEPSLVPLRARPDFDALLTRIGVPRRTTASAPHKRRRDWRRHARAGRPTHDRALQLLHLDALSLRQIDQE